MDASRLNRFETEREKFLDKNADQPFVVTMVDCDSIWMKDLEGKESKTVCGMADKIFKVGDVLKWHRGHIIPSIQRNK